MTDVMPLRQRKKDATRQAISDAAWSLFAEKGYDETSINDIAERAVIAPRTFFRYFPTKEAVMYPDFDQALEKVRTEFMARPTDEPLMVSLITALETLSASMFDDADQNLARFRMMKETHDASIGEYFLRRLSDLVTELVATRDADRPDCEMRARLASGMIGLIMDTTRAHWIETGSNETLHDVGQGCMAILRDLIVAPTRD